MHLTFLGVAAIEPKDIISNKEVIRNFIDSSKG
jgi:hypothetical protein